MKLSIFQVSTVSCYFLPISAKYLLHLRNLENNEPTFYTSCDRSSFICY